MKIDLNKFKLQYISAGNDNNQHLKGIKDVLDGGCKWVQLRIKDENNINNIKKIAFEVKELCKNYDAIFIINDYVDLAKEIDADGVHLGKLDMTPIEARNILGNKIIGGTANSFEDVLKCVDVDYIGLGPYKWTATKKNLSPVLGIDGYKKIFANLKQEAIDIPPVAAIGGIELADASELIDIRAGLEFSGIAVSGNIYNAPNRIKRVKDYLDILHPVI